jgi:tetratricopeptide (TPR) repeat protein
MLMLPLFSFAQNSDPEFANYYFEKGEFEKSLLYFEKLYDKNPNPFYYERLLSCYNELSRYEEAENLIKRQLKKTQVPSEVLIDLAQLYKKTGNNKKAQKAFDDVISELPSNRGYISALGRKLIDAGETDVAEKAYLKGIELLDGEYNFALELADIYGARGDLPRMVDAYISLIGNNPGYIASVQNMLTRYLNFTEEPEKAELVKNSLLRSLQKDPNNTTYNEFLIWVFYQTKNFSGALVQLKALDKRFNETGDRLLDFAQLCFSNGEYSLAADAYNYLITSGKDEQIVEISRAGRARATFLELEQTPLPDEKQIAEAGKVISGTIAEIGTTPQSVELVMDYAQYLLKYRNNLDSAITILEELAEMPGLPERKTALVKLALGDMLIIRSDIWDASLYYSQVDKAFKEDILGSEAKFRNAKISYYTGDFKWAQDQLDVLKASTSKLISNDALNLSLLITDNLGRDSVEEPLKLFAFADLLVFQNLLGDAEKVLDSISLLYPEHPLADEILFEKSEIAMKRKDFVKAAEFLQKIVDVYPTDILGDDAHYRLAEIYEKMLGNKDKARELYQKIMMEYPGSMYTVDARKKFRELRGDKLDQPAQ